MRDKMYSAARDGKIDVVDEYLRNPANPEEKVVFSDVKYFMTTLKIPKDLSCLSGCRLQEIVSFRRKNFNTIYIFSSFSAVKQIWNWLSKWIWRIFQLLPQPPQTKLTAGKTKEKGKVENEMIETEFWYINVSYFLGWLPAESQ